MAKKSSKNSLERNRARAGYTFIAHWVLGIILFFIVPLANSIWYGFNEILIRPGGVVKKFVGLKYFKDLLLMDANYTDNLGSSIGLMLYSLPIIIALSLILAVLLNQPFKGRTVFRAIFFIPVLLSNSVVMQLLNSEWMTMPLFSSGEAGTGIINYQEIIANINVPDQLTPMLVFLLSNTIQLIWSCGVQTILFLAGLQSISPSFYEVSKIEGANKWEEFWLITVPSLRHIISLVLIYTMIELFTDMKNIVVGDAYKLMVDQKYGESSAMLWMYFAIVVVLIGAIYVLYQKLCVKRWE
jgi:ABC-type sugar transport system permease subunit